MKAKRVLTYVFSWIAVTLLISFAKPSLYLYEVKGVDVSRYQGTVDWGQLEEQEIAFAFIKATEGSGHVDARFSENWDAVADTNILASAYHFFSFDSSGITQAENYIRTVGKRTGMLPPAVDIEFYGDYSQNPMEPDKAREILSELLRELERFYHVKPILYTTVPVYRRYLKGSFAAYPLWIRNVYYQPFWDGIRNWSFWQYSDRGTLRGQEGTAIDLNVYKGTLKELESLTVS